MPRWFLSSRNADLIELMDDPDCDLKRLERTYGWFARLNPWLARWNAIYRSRIRPILEASEAPRILDLGCGGADLAHLISRRAAQDGLGVEILAVDPDERAIAYALRQPLPDNVSIRSCSSSDLVDEGQQFDIVLSNHVLHHLEEPDLVAFLRDSALLSRNLVVHNDIRRDDLAWLSFWPVGLVAGLDSFILIDGLRSVRRAWHPEELVRIVPNSWEIHTQTPFRTLLIHRSAS